MIASSNATAAREKFEALLPDTYGPAVEKEGHVQLSSSDARVFESTPRYRGNNRLLDLASTVFGRDKERFTKKERRTHIGKLAVLGWDEEKALLSIYDTLYTPIDPVDGSTGTIRHLHALYRIHTSRDAEGFPHEQGITYDFLEQAGSLNVRSSVGYHAEGDYEKDYAIAAVRDYLEEHEFSTSHQELNRRILDLTDFCIGQAQSA